MKINGQDINSLATMSSMWDHGVSLNVYFHHPTLGKKKGRITTDTLIKMVNEFTFDVVKKRVYFHLENPGK